MLCVFVFISDAGGARPALLRFTLIDVFVCFCLLSPQLQSLLAARAFIAGPHSLYPVSSNAPPFVTLYPSACLYTSPVPLSLPTACIFIDTLANIKQRMPFRLPHSRSVPPVFRPVACRASPPKAVFSSIVTCRVTEFSTLRGAAVRMVRGFFLPCKQDG